MVASLVIEALREELSVEAVPANIISHQAEDEQLGGKGLAAVCLPKIAEERETKTETRTEVKEGFV